MKVREQYRVPIQTKKHVEPLGEYLQGDSSDEASQIEESHAIHHLSCRRARTWSNRVQVRAALSDRRRARGANPYVNVDIPSVCKTRKKSRSVREHVTGHQQAIKPAVQSRQKFYQWKLTQIQQAAVLEQDDEKEDNKRQPFWSTYPVDVCDDAQGVRVWRHLALYTCLDNISRLGNGTCQYTGRYSDGKLQNSLVLIEAVTYRQKKIRVKLVTAFNILASDNSHHGNHAAQRNNRKQEIWQQIKLTVMKRLKNLLSLRVEEIVESWERCISEECSRAATVEATESFLMFDSQQCIHHAGILESSTLHTHT